jgi:hypothetical protein
LWYFHVCICITAPIGPSLIFFILP